MNFIQYSHNFAPFHFGLTISLLLNQDLLSKANACPDTYICEIAVQLCVTVFCTYNFFSSLTVVLKQNNIQ